MGRLCSKLAVGSREHLVKLMERTQLYKIENAECYMGDDGGFYLVCDSDWRNYFADPKAPIPLCNLKSVPVEDLL